nr:MAG TPA: hypothetical protein [Inoviridae sp.]
MQVAIGLFADVIREAIYDTYAVMNRYRQDWG